MFRRNVVMFGVLFVLLVASQPGWSQESRGTILGRITDSSGAVVPDANVELTNIATRVMGRASTNQDGNYFFPYLIPGMYRITVDKAGFKRTARDGIQVNVNDRIELNLALELGIATETVTVTAEAPLLDTSSASVGRVVDFKEVRALPMEHGDPDNIIRLSTGVGFTDQLQKDQPWQSLNTAYTMVGSPQSRNEFTLDGMSNTAHDQARGSVFEAWTPIGETVAEFKVQTMVFDVATGATEGGVVNVLLKSGGNDFHGSAYWSKQFPSITANWWFSNLAGTPPAGFKYNRVGGVLSGPIIIPKVWNGRNRTFFMVGYEYIRSNAEMSSVLTVPTGPERIGDFSALLKVGSNYQIYDPFTRVPAANGRYTNQPLPGNMIPANRISQIAKNILSYYPMPDSLGASTTTADGSNNLNRAGWPTRTKYHSGVYKFDQSVGQKNHVMFRYNSFRQDNLSTDYFGFDNPTLGCIFWNESAGFHLDDVHSFSSTLVMDIHVSDARFVRAQKASPAGQSFDATTLGFPSYVYKTELPVYHMFPVIAISGYTGTGARTPLHKSTQTRNLGVSFDKVHGSHNFKFGADYRSFPDNQTYGSGVTSCTATSGCPNMFLSFDSAYTGGPYDNSPASPVGQGLAAMLYGLSSAGTMTIPQYNDFAAFSNLWAGFFQDSWKATRKLTLTLGLRYEYEGVMRERYNRSVRGFDPTAAQPFAAQVQANYAANATPEVPASQFRVQGGLTFAGVNGQPRGLYESDPNNFAPRVGFAYSLNSKTVIRGGFGMYYGSLGTRLQDPIQIGFSQNTTMVPTLDGGQTFTATMADPFPNGFLQPTGATAGALTNVGKAVNFFAQKPLANTLKKFQIGFQRELWGGWMIDVNYQTSRGGDLEVSRTWDPLPNQYLSTSPTRDQTTINYLTANLPNPFANVSAFTGTSRSGAVIARNQVLAAYPQYTTISSYTYDGKSWYDGVSGVLSRRFARGFTATATYTFSNFIEQNSLLNPGDAAPAKVISTVDFPHHLILSGIYEFPFGHGKPFLANTHGVADLLVSGWQISPIYTYQSGPPITIGDLIFTGDGMHNVPLSKGQRNIYRWFDTSQFNTNTAQQLSYHLRTLSPRFGNLRTDAYNSWDVSMVKDTKLHEKTELQFRFEALNVFNQVCFSPPSTSIGTSFGKVTAQRNVPRHMQFSLRLQF